MNTVLTGTRLSELSRCSRMCALRAIGAPAGDIDPVWERYFARGNLFEFYVYQQYAAEHGKENVQRQIPIPWPLGEGHADLLIVPRDELIEVKSTATPDGPIFDMAVMQVRLYKHFSGHKRAGVYLVNPSDLKREDFIPVKVSSSDEDEIVELVRSVERAVETDGAELPACVCDGPGACRRLGCQFTDVAWDGWEQPEPTPLDDSDGEVAALVQSLYELKRDYKQFNAEAEERKRGYALVQARLAEIGLDPGRDYLINGFKVRRVVTAGSESFSLAKAVKSGNFSEADYERFSFAISPRSGSERWMVDRVSDGAPTDFGTEAPF